MKMIVQVRCENTHLIHTNKSKSAASFRGTSDQTWFALHTEIGTERKVSCTLKSGMILLKQGSPCSPPKRSAPNYILGKTE